MKGLIVDLLKGAGRWLWRRIRGEVPPLICAICGAPAVAVQHDTTLGGAGAHTFLPLRR
jgi:hypothetical protein